MAAMWPENKNGEKQKSQTNMERHQPPVRLGRWHWSASGGQERWIPGRMGEKPRDRVSRVGHSSAGCLFRLAEGFRQNSVNSSLAKIKKRKNQLSSRWPGRRQRESDRKAKKAQVKLRRLMRVVKLSPWLLERASQKVRHLSEERLTSVQAGEKMASSSIG